MAALYTSQPALAAQLLYGSAAVFLGFHALAGDPRRYTTFAISIIPAVLLLRNHYLFSSLVAIFGFGIMLWWLLSPAEFFQLWRSAPPKLLLFATFLYWLASWFNTGSYSSNLHSVEFSLVAVSIFLLGAHRSSLEAAFMGMALTVFCEGIGTFPFGDRLGSARIGSISLGNPITYGLAATLIFLLCVAENGRWLGLERFGAGRFSISLGCAAFLVLSTSRGSWLVAIIGVLVALVFGQGFRANAFWIVISVPVIAISIALSTGRGPDVLRFYNKVASSDTNLGQKTTGRIDQWERLPDAFSTSPIWGHGGGSGASVYHDIGGKELEWHSVYLQLLVETGAMGFVIFAGILAGVGNLVLEHRRITGEILPLLALVCYLAIGVSISALDGMSGVYMGLALLGGKYSRFCKMTIANLRHGAVVKLEPLPQGDLREIKTVA
ncbi:MAG: Lipid core-O-antigen ligase-like enyme [Bryobacterales bacterium]|nr:Lipid core-O-antigen ligase-like enyme [Bryobacterales bacterium]